MDDLKEQGYLKVRCINTSQACYPPLEFGGLYWANNPTTTNRPGLDLFSIFKYDDMEPIGDYFQWRFEIINPLKEEG